MTAPVVVWVCGSCHQVFTRRPRKHWHQQSTGEDRRQRRDRNGRVYHTTRGSWVKCGPIERWLARPAVGVDEVSG